MLARAWMAHVRLHSRHRALTARGKPSTIAPSPPATWRASSGRRWPTSRSARRRRT